jgi:5-methylcytosine-specific restriction enzyme subunit McrC
MADGAREIRLCEHTRVPATLDRKTRDALCHNFGQYLTVEWDLVAESYVLAARQYVGTIEVDDVRIVIASKAPTDNLFYMLTYAYELPQFREEHSDTGESEDLFEFVVEIFVGQVGQLARQGIFRAYVTQHEDEPFLRGRLQLAEQIRHDAIQPGRFWQESVHYTADVPENRILKWTLWRLSRANYRNPLLKSRLRRALTSFSEVSLVSVASDDFDRIVYTRLNAAYQSRINLARLLLQHRSVEGKEGDVSFAAYLFDMNRAFELFVARYLAAHFADVKGPGRTVDVDIQREIWLDEAQRERARPDIVLRRNGRPYLVLDTKHKKLEGMPEESDRHQMLEYCNTLRLRRGVLIYSDGTPQTVERAYAGEMSWTLRSEVLSLTGSLNEFRARCDAFAERFSDAVTRE